MSGDRRDMADTDGERTETRVGAYTLLRKLGQGGMGVVYLAHDSRLQREVALKLLPGDLRSDPERRERFLREARAVAQISHPNVAQVFEIGEDQGQDFIAFEYVNGRTLSERAGSPPPSAAELGEIGVALADAISHAHQRGIVHRDIKLENVMVTDRGHPKLLDFGLARRLQEATRAEAPGLAEKTRLTAEGAVFGTPGSMSPEQAQGKPVDQRSDVFSFGILLYELATGRTAFRRPSVAETLYAVIHEEPEPLEALRPDLPPGFAGIVRRAMRKEREARYPSMEVLLQELQALRGSNGAAPRSGLATPRRLVLALGAVLVAAVLVLRPWRGEARGTPAPRTITSVAVLPFTDLAPADGQGFFVDGMTEALITELGKIGALRVISRTSVMRYKDSLTPVPEIAATLDVGTLVEGTVLRAGDRVRITAKLIDGEQDRLLWSDDFQRDLDDVLALQSDIALAIATHVQAVLTPEEEELLTAGRRVDPAALEAYLLGRQFLHEFDEPSYYRAIEQFERALQLDPGYAEAYGGLARVYAELGTYNIQPPGQAWPRARDAAREALARDERLSEAHAVLGYARTLYDWEFADAEHDLLRAIELNPNNARAHLWLGLLLAATGRAEESVRRIEHARRLDPRDPALQFYEAWALARIGRVDEAWRRTRTLAEWAPDYPPILWLKATLHVRQQEYDRAEEAIERFMSFFAPDVGDEVAFLGFIQGRAGRIEEAREQGRVLEELRTEGRYVSPVSRAYVAIGVGDTDRAFELLEEAYEERATWLLFGDPLFLAPLEGDPRLADLRRRIGLPD